MPPSRPSRLFLQLSPRLLPHVAVAFAPGKPTLEAQRKLAGRRKSPAPHSAHYLVTPVPGRASRAFRRVAWELVTQLSTVSVKKRTVHRPGTRPNPRHLPFVGPVLAQTPGFCADHKSGRKTLPVLLQYPGASFQSSLRPPECSAAHTGRRKTPHAAPAETLRCKDSPSRLPGGADSSDNSPLPCSSVHLRKDFCVSAHFTIFLVITWCNA